MTACGATPLPAREGYRLWAPTYGRETPVTALDQAAVETLCPSLAGRSLLDAGCGTGRRLPQPGPDGPRLAVGIDLVPEMLAAGLGRTSRGCLVAVGDLAALPIRERTFDIVWCRLAIGHIADLTAVYRQLAGVACPGAQIIISDFHPVAAAAGHLRSFRDGAGRLQVIQHYIHQPVEHERAAAGAGLSLKARLDLCVGPAVKPFYTDAGLLEQYERQQGMPVVLALRFRR